MKRNFNPFQSQITEDEKEEYAKHALSYKQTAGQSSRFSKSAAASTVRSHKRSLRAALMQCDDGDDAIVDDESIFAQARSLSISNPYNYMFPGIGADPMLGSNTETWTLPSAVSEVGKNSKVLSDTIVHASNAVDEQLMWNTLVPVKELDPNDKQEVYWSTVEYPAGFAPEASPLAPPVSLVHSRTAGKAHTTRRIIGAVIEAGFMMTIEGRKCLFHQLIQIANTIRQTGYITACDAMRTADTVRRTKLIAVNKPLCTLDEEMDALSETFGVMQLPGPGHLTNMRSSLAQRYAARGCPASDKLSLVMSQDTVEAFMHSNPSAVRYDVRGQDGPSDLCRMDSLGMFTIAGMNIFSVRPMNVGVGTTFSGLQNFAEVGEYYTLYNELGDAKEGYNCNTARSRQIFTQDNGWFTISPKDALKYCFNWNVDGNPDVAKEDDLGSHVFAKPDGTIAKTLAETWWADGLGADGKVSEDILKKSLSGMPQEIAQFMHLKAADGGKDGLLPGFAEDINLTTLGGIVDRNLCLPINFIAVVPHMMYMAYDAILTVPGEFAYRLYQPIGVTLGEDTNTRLVQIIAEFNTGCALIAPEKVVTAHAVFLKKYMGGNSATIANPKHSTNNHPEVFRSAGSIYIIALPPTFTCKPRNINIVGNIVGTMLRGRYAVPNSKASWYERDGSRGPLNGYPGSEYYSKLWHWDTMNDQPRELQDRDVDPVIYDAPVNVGCRRGTCKVFDDNTGKFTLMDYGDGFFKRGMTYTGCASTRNGGMYSETYPESSLQNV